MKKHVNEDMYVCTCICIYIYIYFILVCFYRVYVGKFMILIEIGSCSSNPPEGTAGAFRAQAPCWVVPLKFCCCHLQRGRMLVLFEHSRCFPFVKALGCTDMHSEDEAYGLCRAKAAASAVPFCVIAVIGRARLMHGNSARALSEQGLA